jgi:hypothetical protein
MLKDGQGVRKDMGQAIEHFQGAANSTLQGTLWRARELRKREKGGQTAHGGRRRSKSHSNVHICNMAGDSQRDFLVPHDGIQGPQSRSQEVGCVRTVCSRQTRHLNAPL